MIAFKAMYDLSSMYVSMYKHGRFRGKDMNYLLHILDTGISKKVMLLIYNDLLSDGWITPIENLIEYDKQQLVNECRATGLNFTNETLINSAKILHTIKFINENS